MTPSVQLLSKIGSIIVHADEMMSTDGHYVDEIALKGLIDDPEVREWIKQMGPLLPVKRKK